MSIQCDKIHAISIAVAETPKLEGKLNDLVYQLYGLAKDKNDIVERVKEKCLFTRRVEANSNL